MAYDIGDLISIIREHDNWLSKKLYIEAFRAGQFERHVHRINRNSEMSEHHKNIAKLEKKIEIMNMLPTE